MFVKDIPKYKLKVSRELRKGNLTHNITEELIKNYSLKGDILILFQKVCRQSIDLEKLVQYDLFIWNKVVCIYFNKTESLVTLDLFTSDSLNAHLQKMMSIQKPITKPVVHDAGDISKFKSPFSEYEEQIAKWKSDYMFLLGEFENVKTQARNLMSGNKNILTKLSEEKLKNEELELKLKESSVALLPQEMRKMNANLARQVEKYKGETELTKANSTKLLLQFENLTQTCNQIILLEKTPDDVLIKLHNILEMFNQIKGNFDVISNILKFSQLPPGEERKGVLNQIRTKLNTLLSVGVLITECLDILEKYNLELKQKKIDWDAMKTQYKPIALETKVEIKIDEKLEKEQLNKLKSLEEELNLIKKQHLDILIKKDEEIKNIKEKQSSIDLENKEKEMHKMERKALKQENKERKIRQKQEQKSKQIIEDKLQKMKDKERDKQFLLKKQEENKKQL